VKRRRKNPSRRMLKIGIVAVLLGAATVTTAALLRRRSRMKVLAPPSSPLSLPESSPPPPPPLTPALPEAVAVEPEESWEVRWEQRSRDAVSTCRRDDDVMSWPQAVTCALEMSFPESGPWTDPATWESWQRDAAIRVESDLRERVAQEYGTQDPSGWQGLLWLMSGRVARDCLEKLPTIDAPRLAVCIANSIYPNETWPPNASSPAWTTDFFKQCRQAALNWSRPRPDQ